MDTKPANEILGYLTDRYLRFKDQEQRQGTALPDFSCGRMHQIVCTIADMTGRSVAEVRNTLDSLYARRQTTTGPQVFVVKPVSGHRTHLATTYGRNGSVLTFCGRVIRGGPEIVPVPVSCLKCKATKR